ncbi:MULTISPECIES: type 4a pilus biogenesis protein PilO [unclassified Methylophaga]|uniref:type 4a pilus biogenesis protein PilO n=1 Tax=unclassified Methylophaga TaxID=2629249 RepID=UPI000C9606D2|nr:MULTISPECIES: type 4a pilus biogenesis protein PilO [unclassified Methylophaga]MAK66803.1 pilus assembly protein PilO [Methylophaga sp.]MAY17629.1 pilus assembly protein PilO [Methylophaga sp.]MBN47070.1 pilus assembly protein PilO [Methylophaga sp.]HAO25421.1 pilus assembly protein PilO [Methylophaga sp.]HCD06277.1 pilus assembly protein PilO [Methylophaga sp.]
MDIPSVNDIDFNESGEWPLVGKIVAALLICAVIWGGGYYFLIKDKRTELARLEQTETELRTSFEVKQSKAVNLEAYKEQMKEMEVSFASMLQQLPRKSEVADLLVDISRTGLVNGLEFELFKPEEERPIDFYIELPITMRVTGSYHQFAEFISGIAALPRIVTMHNFKMGPLTANGNMTMDITAKTYRYFDEQGN